MSYAEIQVKAARSLVDLQQEVLDEYWTPHTGHSLSPKSSLQKLLDFKLTLSSAVRMAENKAEVHAQVLTWDMTVDNHVRDFAREWAQSLALPEHLLEEYRKLVDECSRRLASIHGQTTEDGRAMAVVRLEHYCQITKVFEQEIAGRLYANN